MASTYTIDASVFLNAFNPHESGHEISNRFLAQLIQKELLIIVPTLLLPEVAAAISRGRSDARLARDFASALIELPHMIWVPLDMVLSQQALVLAATHHLRGSDAVYVATAARFGSLLITLDHEQRQRVADVILAKYPYEVLNELT